MRPIELKFHMTTPYDWLAKIRTNCSGHMTKMATTFKYCKNSLNIFYSGTKMLNGLGAWYVALGMWALQGLHK